MQNRIDANVEFFYQGKHFSLSSTIDLDVVMVAQGGMPDIYSILARENKIDSYSYEYEVMLMAPVCFDNATGIVANYLENGLFDVEGFESGWYEAKMVVQLRTIAEQHMGVGLEQQAGLKAALIAAYQAGRRTVELNPP